MDAEDGGNAGAGAAVLLGEIGLFPLRNVLFPDGLLQLRVFEARYLDLMSACLRERRPFGVVALRKGSEARGGPDDAEGTELERIGTLAELIDVDAAEPGILQVRCRGSRRFELRSQVQRANGLWVGDAALLPEDGVDDDAPPQPAVAAAVQALRDAVATLAGEGIQTVLEPCRYDSAGWVADRWAELLPFSVATRQRLLELRDGPGRLALVTAFLRRQGVIDP